MLSKDLEWSLGSFTRNKLLSRFWCFDQGLTHKSIKNFSIILKLLETFQKRLLFLLHSPLWWLHTALRSSTRVHLRSLCWGQSSKLSEEKLWSPCSFLGLSLRKATVSVCCPLPSAVLTLSQLRWCWALPGKSSPSEVWGVLSLTMLHQGISLKDLCEVKRSPQCFAGFTFCLPPGQQITVLYLALSPPMLWSTCLVRAGHQWMDVFDARSGGVACWSLEQKAGT